MTVSVRAGRPEDGPALQAIELEAGERFRDVGLGFVADHDPTAVDELAAYAGDGRSWVAEDHGVVIGYAIADVVDDQAHLEQISVRPDRQGAGVGRLLLDQVHRWGLAAGRTGLTLTTFAHVPWNQPLYEHLGFVVLSDEEIGPELRLLMAEEARHGLDPADRVAMRIDLVPSGRFSGPSAG